MNVTLLFTYGVSLKKWDDSGLIDRELLFYRRLAEMGYNISFITYGTKSDLDYKGRTERIRVLPVYEAIKKSPYRMVNLFRSLFIPFRLKKVFDDTDIIKTNQMNGSWVGIIAKYLYRKRLVVRCGFEWYRNAYHRRKKRFAFLKNAMAYILEWLVYRLCDAIIVSNQDDAGFIKERFKINQKKINVISNYVDTELFRPIDTQKRDGRLLYIGRLEKRKNVLNILEAVKGTPYHLDIVGEGEEKQSLYRFVRDNGLGTEFLGTIPNPELPELINRYYTVILTSLYENNPKVLLEAMSCGISVIGADVPGIREIIRHNYNGFLCGTDPASIRDSIKEVLQDEALRKKMGQNARRYILENCSLSHVLEKEIGLYNHICAG